MEYRKFKNTDRLSLLGFGCMRFPVLENGKINEEEAEKMLDEALQNGVNYIDTAYPYHNGDSEPFVGRVLDKYPRDSYFLATKFPVWKAETFDDVVETFNSQLERLNKSYIDYYLIHSLDKEKWEKVKKLGMLDFLDKMRKEGKIRHLGFSFHDDYNVFEEIIKYHDWDFCQIQFNYLDTEEQAGIKGYELAKSMNIPMVIMEPIKGGALASLPEEVGKELKETHSEWSAASWALRFVASHDNVMTILSGMSTMDQVKDNLNTFNTLTEFGPKEIESIKKAVVKFKARIKNPCTGCRYCMPCPSGVNIPRNFSAWNKYSMYDNMRVVAWAVNDMKEKGETADKCVKCGKCEKLCPQHISIRSDLEKVCKDLYK